MQNSESFNQSTEKYIAFVNGDSFVVNLEPLYANSVEELFGKISVERIRYLVLSEEEYLGELKDCYSSVGDTWILYGEKNQKHSAIAVKYDNRVIRSKEQFEEKLHRKNNELLSGGYTVRMFRVGVDSHNSNREICRQLTLWSSLNRLKSLMTNEKSKKQFTEAFVNDSVPKWEAVGLDPNKIKELIGGSL